MPMLDLDPADLGELRRILDRHVPDAEVWAYGSRVTGRAHEGSDLDLVIRTGGNGSPSAALGRLRQALSESDLPILVDVQDWDRIPGAFRREIEKSYVVVREAPPGTYVRTTR
jgi:predicted nucleotidyltransferase